MKRARAETKKFRVAFVIKGSMIDKDTALSEQSLTDFVELHFSHRQDCKVFGVEVAEVKEE